MKKLSLLIVALGVLFTLSASAAWGQDPPPPPPQSQQQPASQEVTARGKVTAVSATSISIEVTSPKGTEGEAQQSPKTMEFVIDSGTKTEGKVESGVTVTITYKVVDGQNLATRVNVEKKK